MKKIQIKKISENVFYVHNPNMHTGIVSMWFRAGSVFDGKTHGIAHLFEHLLLQKTNKHKNGRYEHLESEGIEAYAHTYKEFAYVYHVSKPDTVLKSIALLKEGVFDVFFDTDVLEHEKRVILREIKERTLHEKMWDTLYANLYKNDSRQYPSLGTKNSINQITLEQVKQFFNQKYTQNNCVYVIFTPELLSNTKKNQIKKLTHTNIKKDRDDLSVSTLLPRSHKVIVDDGQNIRYVLSFRLPKTMTKKQKSIVYFIASIFSGNWNSLLTKKLRAEHPYTYWTHNSVLVTYKEKSFHFYFDIAKKDYKEVDTLIDGVFSDFSKIIKDEKKFIVYKHIFATNIHRESEDIKNIMFDIGSALCVGEEPLLPHEILQYISSVTSDDVVRYWSEITQN